MMRKIGYAVLAGVLVVLVEWIWLAAFSSWLDGLSMGEALTVGVGFFLAFEMAFCTCLILCKGKGKSL